jgi:hypothetical protein
MQSDPFFAEPSMTRCRFVATVIAVAVLALALFAIT